ncbi:MAG: citrate transporter [Vicinamibacteria bacterium]|nr:citrate transporter [Vicinamibacteria bacterium]
MPVPFILFALTLLGVALFHRHTLAVAATGLAAIVLFGLVFGSLDLAAHLRREWVILANLFGLLVGFALLADHFERSHVPQVLPRFLPDGWWGAFTLLVVIFVLSSFLDNIAAAMIGGTIAASVFQRKVHIGYVAAIVAASNAGGSGSVIGDTTTTMMWIDGISPLDVLHAYGGAIVALFVVALIAATQQTRLSPILADPIGAVRVDWVRLGIVGGVMAAAVSMNFVMNTRLAEISDAFPFLGVAVCAAIVALAPLRKPNWSLLPSTVKGSLFLLCLVLSASLMPVSALPAASWPSTMALGFVSAVFDNIPLTKLALTQGGYDWGALAYSVGFGGSMIWFGSSAGVAISNLYPEAKSVGRWLKDGWHVTLAFVLGFAALQLGLGWHPHPPHKKPPAAVHAEGDRPT